MSIKKKEPPCHCGTDALVITKRSASSIVSGVLIVTFFIFIAGYFWGHQQALQEFTESIEQQSFADQIHYSLSCCADDRPSLYSYNDSAEQEEEIEQPVADTQPENQIAVEKPRPEPSEKFFAQLVGFQSKEKAYQCMQQISNKGGKVKVAKRSSKTSKGKLYTWYQVVTSSYSSKNELLDHIATIRQIVKLHDVQIVNISNNEKRA